MVAIEEILKEWDAKVKDIKGFHERQTPQYGNVNAAIKGFRELASFLKEKEPILREWMMKYLTEHRADIYIKWWGDHIHNWAKGNIDFVYAHHYLHPDAREEWNRIFGKDRIACFDLADRVVKQLSNKKSINQCDDLTILAIHEEKPHRGDWWCDDCEDQEMRWKNELIRRLTECNHPALNPERRYHLKYRFNDALTQLGNWEPPHEWGNKIYHLGEYVTYMASHRDREVLSPHRRMGQTPFQKMKDLLSDVFHCGGWELPRVYYSANEQKKQMEYIRFLQLWNGLDLIFYSIEMDLPKIEALEEFYV